MRNGFGVAPVDAHLATTTEAEWQREIDELVQAKKEIISMPRADWGTETESLTKGARARGQNGRSLCLNRIPSLEKCSDPWPLTRVFVSANPSAERRKNVYGPDGPRGCREIIARCEWSE